LHEKTEDGTGGKNGASQESKKATMVSSSKLSILPTVSKRNSKQKLAITREKQAVKSTFTRSKIII
jgi:hypothetical protein